MLLCFLNITMFHLSEYEIQIVIKSYVEIAVNYSFYIRYTLWVPRCSLLEYTAIS